MAALLRSLYLRNQLPDGMAAPDAAETGDQLLGSQYFLVRSPSVLNRTLVPRWSRICLVVRLIIPWRLPDWAKSTFPEAVTLKRFFAPDFVFSLGIWLSFPTWTPPYPRPPSR